MNLADILLVEDNDDDVALTLRAFRSGGPGPNIRIVRDGDEAIEALLGSPDGPPPRELPAMVLLDLKLPGLSGFDVLGRIRSHPRTRFLPVVILTSSTEPRDLVEGYRLGANSYVRKPVSFREFVEAAGHMAHYWLKLNQAPEPAASAAAQ